MKMLKHKHSSKTIQPCLAEFSFGINIDGTFDSSKNLSFDVSEFVWFSKTVKVFSSTKLYNCTKTVINILITFVEF